MRLSKDIWPHYETLSSNGKISFKKQYSRQRKSLTVTYLGWLFVGWHYAYLGKWGVQMLYWLSAGGLFIWAFIDLFRIPSVVRSINHNISYEILQNIKAIQ